MSPELQERLFAIEPTWFDREDITRSLMQFGFCHGDGWYSITERLLLAAKARGFTRETFEVIQVKEKFGGLRFYCNGGDAAFRELLREAEAESFRTCESCGGGPVKNRQRGGWYRTQCDPCDAIRERTADSRRSSLSPAGPGVVASILDQCRRDLIGIYPELSPKPGAGWTRPLVEASDWHNDAIGPVTLSPNAEYVESLFARARAADVSMDHVAAMDLALTLSLCIANPPARVSSRETDIGPSLPSFVERLLTTLGQQAGAEIIDDDDPLGADSGRNFFLPKLLMKRAERWIRASRVAGKLSGSGVFASAPFSLTNFIEAGAVTCPVVAKKPSPPARVT